MKRKNKTSPLIGLMGAMHEEIAHLKQQMNVSEIQTIGGRFPHAWLP